MVHLLCSVLLAGVHVAADPAIQGRTVFALDHGWRFVLDSNPPPPPACPLSTFPINLTSHSTTLLEAAAAATVEECAQQCCRCGADCDNDCETYQFCNSTTCGHSPSKPLCMVGALTGANTTASPGWQSFARLPGPQPPQPIPSASCTAAWCMPSTPDDPGKGNEWRGGVNIPHDFVLEGTFGESADMSHGYLPYGVGLYRKHLAPLPPEIAALLLQRSHTAVLEFDGVQANAEVYLDGMLLGRHQSGYTPFSFQLDGAVLARLAAVAPPPPSLSPTMRTTSASPSPSPPPPPLPLVLAIRADATRPDGWWYDGGGIYRSVRLIVHGSRFATETYTRGWH
jgi:hypothetical protein